MLMIVFLLLVLVGLVAARLYQAHRYHQEGVELFDALATMIGEMFQFQFQCPDELSGSRCDSREPGE